MSVLIEGLDVFNDFLVISERENGLTRLNVMNLKDQNAILFKNSQSKKINLMR